MSRLGIDEAIWGILRAASTVNKSLNERQILNEPRNEPRNDRRIMKRQSAGMIRSYPGQAIGGGARLYESVDYSTPTRATNNPAADVFLANTTTPTPHHGQVGNGNVASAYHNSDSSNMTTPSLNNHITLGHGLNLGMNKLTLSSPPHTGPSVAQVSQLNRIISPQAVVDPANTVPHNFAPRSNGVSVTSRPPPGRPNFNLGLEQFAHNSAAVTDQSQVQQQRQPQSPDALAVVQAHPAHDLVVAPLPPPIDPWIKAQRSPMLNELTDFRGNLPPAHIGLGARFFPFTEGTQQVRPANYGIVRLKNIPYSAKRSEIIAFLGKNSKILNDVEEPVHIIMERLTSKTMDAFVEFYSLEDAIAAISRHKSAAEKGRLGRIGERAVELELSSQADLMTCLFPYARGLRWNGVEPIIMPKKDKEPWENFQGFVTNEEMIMLVKHAEVPERAPFSKESRQRPFECLISTIKKLPWYCSQHITVQDRYAVYDATIKMLFLLQRYIEDKKDPVNLNRQLEKRLIGAAMRCPGFNHIQKDGIVWLTSMDELDQRAYGQPRFSNRWTHQYDVVVKPGMPLDLVEWYIAIIREHTEARLQSLPIHKRDAIDRKARENGFDMYWGYFWHELNLTPGPHLDKMTLKECAVRELNLIEEILREKFPFNAEPNNPPGGI